MTDYHNYNIPAEGAADWHIPLNENFKNIDKDVEIRDVEGNLGDYSPKSGAKFFATDTGNIYLGDGSQWKQTPTTSITHQNFALVGPTGRFASLNDAYSNITDASPDNRYLLWLTDDISESEQINAKSHINVVGNGSVVTVEPGDQQSGMVVDATDATFLNLEVRRTGTVSRAREAINVKGASDNSVTFRNVIADNRSSGQSDNHGFSINPNSGQSPRFINCVGIAPDADDHSYRGIAINGGDPVLAGCLGFGGQGGKRNIGIKIGGSGAPQVTNCQGYGDHDPNSGGNDSHGIAILDSCNARVAGCYGRGAPQTSARRAAGISIESTGSPVIGGCVGLGGLGTRGWGMVIERGNPTIAGCAVRGGAGEGTSGGMRIRGGNPMLTGVTARGADAPDGQNNGIVIERWASPTMSGCAGIGGGASKTSRGILIRASASPIMSGCIGTVPRYNHTHVYQNNSEEPFRPQSKHPYFLWGMQVRVDSPGSSGSTMDIGTTAGGNEIASNIPIDSTGPVHFEVNPVERAAGEDMYLNPTDTSVEFNLKYITGRNYRKCYGLRLAANGRARVHNSIFMGNMTGSQSNEIDPRVGDRNTWWVSNCAFLSPDPESVVAVGSNAEHSSGKLDNIFNCTFEGGTDNNLHPKGQPEEGLNPDAVAIDSTGHQTLTINHGLPEAPPVEKIHTHIVNPSQTDWSGHIMWVDNVTTSSFDVHVNIQTASGTSNATADLSWRIELGQTITG